MKKRTISILLALVMVLSEASMCVFALDAEPQQGVYLLWTLNRSRI